MPGIKAEKKILAARSRQYGAIRRFVETEIAAGNSEELVLGYLVQKAKVENNPNLCGVIVALAINISWQIIVNFVLSQAATVELLGNIHLGLTVSCAVTSFIILFGSLFAAYTIFDSNRRKKEELLFRERIMKKEGLID